MQNVILGVVAAIVVLVAVLALIWAIRVHFFRPTKNKRRQLHRVNRLIEPSGFAYEPTGDYFYSLMNCWQRQMGYCRLYDEAAPFFNMIMDCEPISFAYGGKRWLIEFWKGQYGITAGGEIGIYNTGKADIETGTFSGVFYEAIEDGEMLDMSFEIRRDGKLLVSRQARHWWLTGFVPGFFSDIKTFSMEARITFTDPAMLAAFVQALRAAGYRNDEYQVQNMMVIVHFTKPHTEQPATQTGVQRGVAQGLNRANYALYQSATAPYTDTLDQLEFIHAMAPDLFKLLLRSLYSEGVFEAFDTLAPKQALAPASGERHAVHGIQEEATAYGDRRIVRPPSRLRTAAPPCPCKACNPEDPRENQ